MISTHDPVPHILTVYPMDVLPFAPDVNLVDTTYLDHDVYYEIEHPEDCPAITEDPEKECLVLWEFSMVGDWESLMGYDNHQPRWNRPEYPIQYLPAGRYEVVHWENHYPGGPWGGPEWDSGLEVEPIP